MPLVDERVHVARVHALVRPPHGGDEQLVPVLQEGARSARPGGGGVLSGGNATRQSCGRSKERQGEEQGAGGEGGGRLPHLAPLDESLHVAEVFDGGTRLPQALPHQREHREGERVPGRGAGPGHLQPDARAHTAARVPEGGGGARVFICASE